MTKKTYICPRYWPFHPGGGNFGVV